MRTSGSGSAAGEWKVLAAPSWIGVKVGDGTSFTTDVDREMPPLETSDGEIETEECATDTALVG